MKGFLNRRRDMDPNPCLFLAMFSSGELDVPAVFCQFLRSCATRLVQKLCHEGQRVHSWLTCPAQKARPVPVTMTTQSEFSSSNQSNI